VTGVEPELLTRRDVEHGPWTVEPAPVRRGGGASTSIHKKVIRVPLHDTDQAHSVRIHEMIHAKISPVETCMDRWVAREYASGEALVAAEEFRVNHVARRLKFNLDAMGTEADVAAGEQVVATNDWANAVMTAIIYAETGSLKKFLVGVRRHNKEWAKILQIIVKRAVQTFNKVDVDVLMSTKEIDKSGLAPRGFLHTEKLAEYLDRLASSPPPVADDSTDNSTDDSTDDSAPAAISHTNENLHKPDGVDFDDYADKIKAMMPTGVARRPPTWTELRIGKIPLDVTVSGSIGKKRIATNVGKYPRRMHRFYTDPDRKVFDRVIRGPGGFVIIDCSGSMQLTKTEVRSMVENAPGCTVLGYTDRGDDGENAWILAQNGKMASDFPSMGVGNGVDFPALQWAVKNRKRSNETIIFVTDGGVCGKNSAFDEGLAMQCINYCRTHGIKVVPDAKTAVETLARAKNGMKPTSVWPAMFLGTWKQMMREDSIPN